MKSKLIEFLEKEVKRLGDAVQSDMAELLDLPVNRDVEQLMLKIRIKLYREELVNFEKALALAKAEAPKNDTPDITVANEKVAKNDGSSISMSCTSCGVALKSGAKFCPSCGAKQEAKKTFCAECGVELKAGAKFCPTCGTPVNLEAKPRLTANEANATEAENDIYAQFAAKASSRSWTSPSKTSSPSASTSAVNPSSTARRLKISVPFEGELTPKKEKDGWGYVDETGKWIIEPKSEWDEATEFNEKGIARITDENEFFRFIDKTGNYVSELIYNFYNRSFPGGYSWATRAQWSDDEDDYVEGLAGIIDITTGKWVVRPSRLYDDLNWDSSIWYIGEEENWPESVKEEYGFEEGEGGIVGNFEDENKWTAKKKGNKYGMVDGTGEWRIEPKFDKLTYFSDGRCAACIKGKWGYIDRDGQLRVPAIYDDGTCFYNGVCEVDLNGESFEIDKNGNRI